MKKICKTILIISIFLPFTSAQAVVDNLIVGFQQTPLFNEANLLPGEGVNRWVKVTNNSGQTQRIATQPLNVTDPNHLGDVLNLEIKEGGVVRYNNALSTFFAGGENYLSDLANGATTQYDFTVSFYSGAQSVFQGKSLGFDILIGFQGTEGGILPGAGSTSGGGGSGGLPAGLTIQNETTVSTTEYSVIITWATSYPATSQIIYAQEGESHILDLTDNAGTPPKYGYTRTTPEYDTPANLNGVKSHSITISGLTSGTTYYYRAVSHGSLAISREYSFTTLGVKKEEIFFKEEVLVPKEVVRPTEELIEEKTPEEIGEKIISKGIEKRPLREILAAEGFLAAIGVIPFNLKIILIITGIAVIGLIILRLIGKRKIKT